MPEPAIVSFGKAFRDRYPKEAYIEVLLNAFIERPGQFVVLYTECRWSDRFLAACVAWAIEHGHMTFGMQRAFYEDLEWKLKQSFVLTEKGRDFLARCWREKHGTWTWYTPGMNPPKEPELEWIDPWREY